MSTSPLELRKSRPMTIFDYHSLPRDQSRLGIYHVLNVCGMKESELLNEYCTDGYMNR